MIIVVTGSVAAGKTSISKLLSKKLNFNYLDVNEFVENNKLRRKYVQKFDAYEIDVSELSRKLANLIKNSKKSFVIDSHLSHYLSRKYVDYCIVCKCDIKILKKRLENRGYNKIKIRENLDSEIFDVCLVDALENKHNVIVVDTDKKNLNACVKEILEKIIL
ncbi:adenylate kinase family protein [Candidatus Woesearchaeota archaeon]|nr:adenylate kinase family protein [Candidatus Woesearchaeota archaeon]